MCLDSSGIEAGWEFEPKNKVGGVGSLRMIKKQRLMVRARGYSKGKSSVWMKLKAPYK